MQSASKSPTRQLSESLEAFHISSPVQGQIQMHKKKQKRMGVKPTYKRYTENESFPNSQFGESQIYDEDSSYVRRLSNWSMSYGTVQVGGAKVKQRVFGGTQEEHQEEGGQEEAQWRQYLRSKQTQECEDVYDFGTAPMDRNLNMQESDLVVTTSLSDISLMPTNTFKRRTADGQGSGSRGHGSEASSHLLSSKQQSQVDLNVDADDDPAQAAKTVFDKVLRHQRSNFLNSRGAQLPKGGESDMEIGSGGDESQYDQLHSRTSSSSSSSFRSQPISPSPTGTNSKENSAGHVKLKLIRPEDAGMVFDHQRGVWEPLDEIALGRRSSVNIGALTTVNTTISHEDTGESMTPKHGNISSSYPYQDDTPLAPPRLAEKFKLPKDTMDSYNSLSTSDIMKKVAQARQATLFGREDPGNITDVGNLETSFSLSQSAVVRALLDVIPNKQNWASVDDLDLSNKQLESLVGLDQLARSCSVLDVSNNELTTLQGVPTGCIHLACGHNSIGSYASLNNLPHLETLNLSHNELNVQNLSMLEPCRHLKTVDLSFNNITGMSYMPSRARILRISLANNKLAGSIDFQQLCSESKAWRHVEELDLSGNTITALTNLDDLTHLRILRLDGNPIKSIYGNGNAQIRTLTMQNNTVLHTISGFPALRILKCRGESLQLVQDSLPETLETLEILGSHNNSTDQWNWSKILPKYLRTLKLRKMQLSAVPPIISSLPLHSLDLTYNCIINTTQLIQSLPSTLQELNILGNPLWAVNDTDRRMLVEAIKLYLFSLRGS